MSQVALETLIALLTTWLGATVFARTPPDIEQMLRHSKNRRFRRHAKQRIERWIAASSVRIS